MRTRMYYEGREERGNYSAVIFVINGKGDWGDGEPWNDEEYDVALDLARYISDYANVPEPIYEGYAVWFCNNSDWGIMDWRADIEEAYREWKRDNRGRW